MNKIVHEHIPASALPEELREGIDASALVTVTVQEEEPRIKTLEQLRRLLEDARRDAPGISTEEAVARVRELRDEWDG
jgi:hypothetical protein